MPSRSVRSAAALAFATSATTFAYVGSAAPAQAASADGYCKTSAGVTVVVDFRNLGGGIAIRCSPVGSGATGLDALRAAGIPVEGTKHDGLGFACRIYGKPDASREACFRTPPGNAHWWYSKASNGGSWYSSGDGYATSKVIPGGFEGWAFSEGGTNYAPRSAPVRPKPSSPPPPPKPTHTTTKPAPPRHTTATTPKHTSTTDSKGDPAAPQHDGSSAGAQPKSTNTSKTSSAAEKSKKAKASKQAEKSRSASASSASKAKHSTGSSSSSGAANGTSSGAATNAAGVPVANSDELIKDNKKSASGINATTVVGGVVLVALAVGGGVVAIIRRRNLG